MEAGYQHQQPSNLDMAEDYIDTQTKATPKFEHRAQDFNRPGPLQKLGLKQTSYSAYPGQIWLQDSAKASPEYCRNCKNCQLSSNLEQRPRLRAQIPDDPMPSNDNTENKENSYSEDNLLQYQSQTHQYPTLSCENQTGEQTHEQIQKVDRDLSMLSFNDSIGGMPQFQNKNCQAPGTQPHATLFNSREATVMADNTGLFSCHQENRVLLSLFKDGRSAPRASELGDQVNYPTR